jgi:Protein of unknown function (DUF3618)
MAEITTGKMVAPDHRLPPGRGAVTPAANGRPGDPDALRRDIEATRARMSRTLDEIEGRLVRQKEELVARATLRDFRRRISSEPWRSMVIAFAAGYIVAAIRD